MEEACLMGFGGGYEQGKLETALPELKRLISFIPVHVNPKPKRSLNLSWRFKHR
jgi:hypothetical protein